MPDVRNRLRELRAARSWSQADLAEFLKTGHNRDGTAFGSMIDVVNNSTPTGTPINTANKPDRPTIYSVCTVAVPNSESLASHIPYCLDFDVLLH